MRLRSACRPSSALLASAACGLLVLVAHSDAAVAQGRSVPSASSPIQVQADKKPTSKRPLGMCPVDEPAPAPAPSAAPAPAPGTGLDLAITNLTVEPDCRVTARIENVGCVALPAGAATDIAFSNGAGGGLGGSPLDAQQLSALTAPRGWTTFTTAYKVDGTVSVKAVIDSASKLAEANEVNNAFTRSLTCAPKLPDLTVSVTTNASCANVIELKNVGTGDLPAGLYDTTPPRTVGPGLERTIDGVTFGAVAFKTLDPARTLLHPGGKVTYTEPPIARAYRSYSYRIASGTQEASTTNNAAAGTMTGACAGTRPAHDATKRTRR